MRKTSQLPVESIMWLINMAILGDISERQSRVCEAKELRCALSMGIPAVVGLIVTLVIYTICR